MPDVHGVPLPDLPEGWQAIEAVVVLKCLAPEGKDGGFPYRTLLQCSEGLTIAEAAGMAGCAEAEAKRQFTDSLQQSG